ncbi:SMC domain-containing protein [Psychromonas sp. CNPT3]|uniref:ATP-binding protein n=1 Tax=Psychromonas sp. CNPT3 TaxID=314282 RepID=UPI00006E56B5|nr:ATP-binding protein [Psychromonas sp. CNPT3]AGH81331.1 SMC domain-containing protein [Psychromonas sp. CNPT3]
MAQSAYQLLRIIIIDSFWKGQVNELCLTGHTQLEGTNGAGKTSLMRLLPLFYGMRPSDIVSKVDQARNFADYYLPNDSSMLIYEYKRPYGQTCMVLASSDGRGVHFKFIDSAYDSALFIDKNQQPLSVNEVERIYRHAGAETSNFLGIDKYRQVIQNLRSGRKLKEIRNLQKRFSFSEQPMPHIDKVINGTIEKNLDFDAVKRMLVAIASDHLARDTLDNKEQISLNKEDIQHWLADIQASRAIQKVAEKIKVWQTDFTQLDSLLVKLQHLHVEIVAHQKNLEEVQAERKTEKQQARESLDRLEIQLEESSKQFRQEIAQLNALIEADQSRIDLLESDKWTFDEKDAASFQVRADQVGNIEQQLQEVNAIIDAFEGNVSKIQGKFEKLTQVLKLQHLQDISANQAQTANIKEQVNKQLLKINDTYQTQLLTLNQQLHETHLKLNLHAQALELKLEKILSAQQNPQLDAQLLAVLETNQNDLNLCHENQNVHLQNNVSLQSHLTTLEKQRETLLDKHKKENRELLKLREQCFEVEMQLLPQAGSLQYFLSNEPLASQWKDNIGRVLSTEQLRRTDLAPQWKQQSDTLYGLQLDLQVLQENDLQLNETELREKLNTLEAKIISHVAMLSNLEEQLTQINKQIDAQKINIFEASQKEQQNQLKLQQLKVQQQNIQAKKIRMQKESAKALDVSVTSLKSEIKAHQQKMQSFAETEQDERHDLQNLMLEQRMVVESDRDSQLSQLSAQHQEIESNVKARLSEHKKQKNTALQEIDPDGEVDKCNVQRTKLETELEKCAVWARKAREYEQFMSQRYVHLPQLLEVNQNRNIELRGFQNSLEELLIEKNTQIKTLHQRLKKYITQLRTTEDLLYQLRESQENCEKHGIALQSNELEPNNEADLSVSFCFDWLEQFKGVEKRLAGELKGFTEKFRKDHSSSELYENWQALLSDNDQFQGARTLFKYRSAIADLLSSAAQKQKNTYQLVTINANMINEFYQHIKNFGQRIKSIGKLLSKNVTALASFEALADINVYTVMKQEELEYWGPLQQFSTLFEKYRDELREGSGEIPDDLVYAMQKLASYLPSEGFVLELEQLFDIEFSILEKGQLKHARNARQLKKISSTGLSYLAMLSLFAGILGMLRGNDEHASQIILPVDELGELAAENIDLLLKMFNANHISILSASPSTDRHILSLYHRHYKLKDNKIYHAEIPTSRLDELLALRKNKVVVEELDNV